MSWKKFSRQLYLSPTIICSLYISSNTSLYTHIDRLLQLSNMALPFNLISQTRFNLRISLLIAFSVSIFIILLGSGLNHLNHKYLRALPHESCAHQILNVNMRNSLLCCDTHYRQLDWVCIASFDNTNKILSSTYALVLPFSLVLATAVVELLAHLFAYGLTTKGVAPGRFLLLVRSTGVRLLIVFLLLFLRTVSYLLRIASYRLLLCLYYNLLIRSCCCIYIHS
jgi:hypothetical protein